VQLPPFTNLLVLADQFEEIFRFQQQDPNEALSFVNLLLETSRDRSVPIFIVMTMRTDFLGQCALFPGLPESLNDSQYLCPRMSRDQLAEAIKGPAEVFGATVEPALVTQLLNDAGANSDQLPLVQHVLARIWRIWHGCPQDGHGPAPEAPATVLRLKNYQDRGGLIGFSAAASATSGATAGIGVRDSWSGMGPGYSYRQNALSEHADEAYLELGDSRPESRTRGPSRPESRIGGPDHNPSHKQVIAQMLFRCLAERGPSGQFVRRPIKVRDVAAVAGCSVDEVVEVAEVFRREDRSFLVPPVGVTLTADSVLDISHEALIRQWQRFGGQSQESGEHEAGSWLEIEEQSRRRYRRLVEAAENEPTAGLLRNPELEFLNLWWEDFRPSPAWANACVKESFDRTHSFLKRSLAQAAADKAAAEAEQRERLVAAEATARMMTRRSIFISVVALVSVGLAIVAWRAQARAVAAEGRALSLLELQRRSSLRNKELPASAFWAPGSTIRIGFLDGDTELQARVITVAREWTRYANLRFEVHPIKDADVRITLESDGGIWSLRGTACLNQQDQNPTACISVTRTTTEAEFRRRVLFVFGHILGLYKESQNPSSNIPWNKEAIYSRYRRDYNMTAKDVDEQVFRTWSKDVFGGVDKPFDPDSIMLLSVGSTDTVDGFETTQPSELSEGDKKFISRLYPE
jgi:hypothetical protein